MSSLKAFAKSLEGLSESELRRMLVQAKASKRLGLVWERNDIERDKALNADVVLPKLQAHLSHGKPTPAYQNMVIEGDNFDALRLLKATHANKIKVIFIDPPYNTGANDWVYNDHFMDKNDGWRHSKWLEFLYQRLVLARDLLTPDGVMMVCIDDDNRAKLDMLLEEVFPNGRKGSFVWRVRSGGNDTKGSLLSANHEHVLVYANDSFEFKGETRDEEDYKNPDEDKRGEWCSGDLNQGKTAIQRPEAYYHLQNPKTGVWYLCDPDSVWRFASNTRPAKKTLQADPMEVILAEDRVLWPGNQKTVVYGSVAEIQQAIKNGSAPKQLKIYSQLKQLIEEALHDDKVARLVGYIDPIDTWVGRTIGYGKPRYKRFLNELKRDVAPVSSWLVPAADKEQAQPDSDDVELTVGATAEGTAMYKKLMGNKDFPYPKPLSLVQSLLDQATRENDLVLDFFAGSGTTAHAVLALNAKDGGKRRFIMCSSTEATIKNPSKNLCRDITAERIKRVMVLNQWESNFAYVQLEKYDPAEVQLDASNENTRQLLAMRVSGVLLPNPQNEEEMEIIGVNGEEATVVMHKVSKSSIGALVRSSFQRLIIYCNRPDTVQERLKGIEKSGVCYATADALVLSQAEVNT